MEFCIRDDDTSYFTAPDDLDRAYGEITRQGPVSLAVVPFHRAGTSGVVPERYRGRWTVHPLHENRELVEYLRAGISAGRYEIMLHGYHHDDSDGTAEFARSKNIGERMREGRSYLEDLLGTRIRVFVPPWNTIGASGLRALAREGLHLGGAAGLRGGWSPLSIATWRNWLRLRSWQRKGGIGVPWVLDLGDHREIPGTPVTPSASFAENRARFQTARAMGGVFCLATHYWEMQAASLHEGAPNVREHLRHFVELAASDPSIVWRTVGEIVAESESVA
jgi:peptidoglycan/xylan/chitin deacetylase (PgdA/CDA1 family)